jgi:tRNA (guanine10-N2)-dimethyltransferase
MDILSLSMEHPDLSLWEAKELLKFKEYKLFNRYLILDKVNKELLYRLGYTSKVFNVLFLCNFKDILDIVSNFDLNKAIKGSYKIFYENINGDIKKQINDLVWDCLTNPIVKMKDPDNEIYFIKIKNQIYCCIKTWENKDDFDSRLPHKRIGLRPISLKPRFARALVNLTGCKKGTIVDPMTGTSGVLIEALLCGLKAEGYDINEVFLRISEVNLQLYGSDYIIGLKDFFSINKKIPYIVTDLPYGKNTKSVDFDFYKKVVDKLEQILTKRAIVIFPSTINIKELIRKSNLKLIKTFTIFVHNSMSRVVCVIDAK